MTSSVQDVLWPEPRIAILHHPDFDDLDLVQVILQKEEMQRLLFPVGEITDIPEIITLRTRMGDENFMDPWLRLSPWFNTSVAARTSVDTGYEDAVAEILSYATHVLVFWNGDPELMKLIKRHGHDIKLKMVRTN